MATLRWPDPSEQAASPISDERLAEIFRHHIYWEISPRDVINLIERLRQIETQPQEM